MFLGSLAAPHRISPSQLFSASLTAGSLEAVYIVQTFRTITASPRPYINMCAHARNLTDCNSCLIAQDAAFPFSWFASRGSVCYPAVCYRSPLAKNNCSRGETWKICAMFEGGGAVSFTASESAGPVVYLTCVWTTSCSVLLSVVIGATVK